MVNIDPLLLLPTSAPVAILLALALIAIISACIYISLTSPAWSRAKMRAVYYHHHMGRVIVGSLPRPPSPGPGQLLVRVHAAALNPADWKQAGGESAALLSFQWPRVCGFDFSGVVEEAGADDGRDPERFTKGRDRFAVGKRVFGMIRGLPQLYTGTLAEYVLVDADVCARCPAGVSHAECASVPLVAITAARALRACGLTEEVAELVLAGEEPRRAPRLRPRRHTPAGPALDSSPWTPLRAAAWPHERASSSLHLHTLMHMRMCMPVQGRVSSSRAARAAWAPSPSSSRGTCSARRRW